MFKTRQKSNDLANNYCCILYSLILSRLFILFPHFLGGLCSSKALSSTKIHTKTFLLKSQMKHHEKKQQIEGHHYIDRHALRFFPLCFLVCPYHNIILFSSLPCGCWTKNRGGYPQIIHFNKGFPWNKPSILGYVLPLFLEETPHVFFSNPRCLEGEHGGSQIVAGVEPHGLRRSIGGTEEVDGGTS